MIFIFVVFNVEFDLLASFLLIKVKLILSSREICWFTNSLLDSKILVINFI